MKILHTCLAAFYIDNYGYQENVLPKMHKRQGHDVQILASTETYLKGNVMSYLEPSVYYNEDQIKVTRISYVKVFNHFVSRKLRFYIGIDKNLKEFAPDIIFIHDIQFLGIFQIVKYLKKNPGVIVYADGHADFTNSGTNFLSKYILHGFIYKICALKIDKYVHKFYGTLPCRVDFFKNFYRVSKDKVELLVMGVDDDLIQFDREKNRHELFLKNQINNDDFVIISGGKIDKKKNIHYLIDAVSELNNSRIKLILFGIFDKEVECLVKNKLSHKSIIFLGWLNNIQVHRYLAAAHLCVFPGKHSVLWEQSAGIGIPGMYKKIKGHEHIDLGGNCILLENGDKEEIKINLNNIISNRKIYNELLYNSKRHTSVFSYYDISCRAINS
jgi:glycosyltransferase involved in cell wall biosynthesis